MFELERNSAGAMFTPAMFTHRGPRRQIFQDTGWFVHRPPSSGRPSAKFSGLYYTILYYTIPYHTILYYTILYYTIPYYTMLYYTILYYTIPWVNDGTNRGGGRVLRSYTSKGIGRQGIGSFVRKSYVSTLCPVVICPYLCALLSTVD